MSIHVNRLRYECRLQLKAFAQKAVSVSTKGFVLTVYPSRRQS
jgi:hypothetical protein